jgi:two-component system chemotaxis response regulator CheY
MAYMAKRVLIVDDHVDSRFICRELLNYFGYAVDEAANGAEALQAFAANPPDMVLLDFLLPQQDGLEVLAELRELPEYAKTPIVLYTAAATHAAELAAHPHVSRVLLKPVETAQLMRVVRELVGPPEIPA